MTRYAALVKLFIESSLMANLEYRVNFIGAMLMSGLDALWSIGGALLFYSHSDTLGGWTFHQTLIVIGLFFFATAFVDTVLQPNVADIAEHIRSGSMDFVLTKPLNSQFHATLRRFRFDRLSGFVVGAILIVYALAQLRVAPTLGQVVLFAGVCLCAAALLYAAMTIVAAVAFWVVEIANINELVFGLLEITRYPAQAFPAPVRGLIMFVVPIAFITTVPAEVLLGTLTPAVAAYGCACAVALTLASRWVWRAAVRQYSSASS